MSSCTDAGRAVTNVKKPITVRAGSKAADAPRRIVYGRAKVGGLMLYAETTGTTNENLHLIFGLCDGPIESIDTIYFGNEVLTLDGSGNGTGKWDGLVSVTKHLGESTQTADAALVAASASNWTEDHRLRGIAYLYIKLVNWDSGGPAQNTAAALFQDMPDVSAVVKGRNDISDPRNSTVGYSNNPALCLAHYRALMKKSPLDSASIIAAANVCDVIVGAVPRYVVGGVVESSASPEDTIRQFLYAMAGTLSAYAGTQWLRIGEPAAPTLKLTWDDLLSEPTMERTTGSAETETVTYEGEDTNFALADSGGEGGKNTVRLDLVDNADQAQRLETIQNKKAGPSETITTTVRIKYLDLVPGDALDVDLQPDAYGRYEVTATSLNLEVDPGINLTLTKERAGLYDDTPTAAPTHALPSVGPRKLAVTMSGTGAGPWSIHAEFTPGSTARYAAYVDWVVGSPLPDLGLNDGLAYYGDFSLPISTVPGRASYASVAVFREGWEHAQGQWPA